MFYSSSFGWYWRRCLADKGAPGAEVHGAVTAFQPVLTVTVTQYCTVAQGGISILDETQQVAGRGPEQALV